jgi:hypothetical protein
MSWCSPRKYLCLHLVFYFHVVSQRFMIYFTECRCHTWLIWWPARVCEVRVKFPWSHTRVPDLVTSLYPCVFHVWRNVAFFLALNTLFYNFLNCCVHVLSTLVFSWLLLVVPQLLGGDSYYCHIWWWWSDRRNFFEKVLCLSAHSVFH